MTAPRCYRVYDRDSGALLCEGTIKDCARKLKCAGSALYNAYEGRFSQYMVFKACDGPCGECEQLSQCEKDDKFCAAWWDWFRLDYIQNLYNKQPDKQTLKPKMEVRS